jgi:putative addiction module component (TIGR02574 family)
MHPAVEQLRQLPVAEKLRVVEELWDDIAASTERFPLPSWHRVEVERRPAELEANPSLALDREELWRRVESARNG